MRFWIFLLLLLPRLAGAEPATIVRATEVKKDPATDAATLATLPENAAVEAGERRAGWTHVKTASAEGWVRMLSLRYGAAAPRAGDSGITQLFNVARTGSSGTQVTTGVRGLDADMIRAAQPNGAELAKLDGYSAAKDASAQFAKSAKLEPQAVEYPAP